MYTHTCFQRSWLPQTDLIGLGDCCCWPLTGADLRLSLSINSPSGLAGKPQFDQLRAVKIPEDLRKGYSHGNVL